MAEYQALSSHELSSRLRSALDPVAQASEGFSGRTLRKVPFIALALFIRATSKPNLEQFIQALNRAVLRQTEERRQIAA